MAAAPLTLLGLPSSILGVGTILVFIVFGILYIVGLFSNALGKKQKIKDDKMTAADNATEFVINALKEQISVLERKVAEQETDIKQMSLQLATLSGENKNLKDLLLGRDEDTKRFQKLGFETFPELMKIVAETNINVMTLYQAIERHLSAMEKSNSAQ